MAFIASGGGSGQEWKTAPDATNYIDMWEKVKALANSGNQGVASITSIDNGGTGYAVGDFVRIADGVNDVGGTAVHPTALSGCTATFEVTAVSGGAVTALRLRQSGCYSTLPANNGTALEYDTVALTGAGNDDLEIDVTWASPGWTTTRETTRVTAATIGDTVGTGYVASTSVVDLVGGDTRSGFDAPQSTNAARFTVPATLSTGESFTIDDAGIYHRQAGTDEVVTSVVSGGGDDTMTADVTYGNFTGVNTTTDREMILTSTDGFVVGIRTFTDGAAAYNWEIMGCQTYVAANDWESQLVQSPGRYPDDDDGSYVILENATFSYWLTVTDRYIMLVANIGVGIYSNMWLGAFDKFGTDTQYPTPLAVLGCCSVHTEDQSFNELRWAGMNLAIADESSSDGGPGAVLTPGAGWLQIRNGHGDASGGDIDGATDYVYANIIPGGDFDPDGSPFTTANEFVETNSDRWKDFAYVEDPGSTFNDEQLITMGNSGGDEFPQLWPMTIVDTASAEPRVLGEVAGARWVDKRLDASVLNSEDEIDDGTNYWYVFNNCRLDRDWSYFVMKGA